MSKRREIPVYKKIIETHFHLDMLKKLSHDEVLELSKKHNIEKMITIATSRDNLDVVMDLANKYPQIFCTQGVHPHDAKDYDQMLDSVIRSHLKDAKNKKIVAVGEIGLDYYYKYSTREEQIKAFEAQLQLALDFQLPVIVHSRDAEADTMDILKNFSKHKNSLVIHSFTSSIELAEFAIKNNFYLGFNGIITFKNAQNVRDALNITPIERVLIETDAPFLTPEPYRGTENAPHFLPFIAEKIAELKNIPLDNTLDTLYQNSEKFFFS